MMKESTIRMEIQRAMSSLGLYYHHAPDINHLEFRSRPDTIAIGDTAAVIEAKRVIIRTYKNGTLSGMQTGTFEFSEIRDNQRHLLDSLMSSKKPVYLALGCVSSERVKGGRSILVIPWEDWVEVENAHPASKSIYWHTILDIFKPYLLERKDGEFVFPKFHNFAMRVRTEHPFVWIETPISRRFEKEKTDD